MESSKEAPSAMELPGRPVSPCWKKKEPDAGFLADVKDHFDQFVNTSMDQHRICLKKTIRGMGDYVKLKKQGKMVVTESNSGAKDAERETRT